MDEYISQLRDFVKDHKLASLIAGAAFLFFALTSFLRVFKVVLLLALLAALVLLGVNLAQRVVKGKDQIKRPSHSMRMGHNWGSCGSTFACFKA